jgi:menaquinone-dependent protoporphyrinogen oxidase
MSNVLIAYASKYGATRDIAKRIAQVLERSGLSAEVKEAESVSSLNDYNAVIIGSSVYFSNWLPEASELLESFQDELAAKPVWLFSSGLALLSQPKGWLLPETLQPLVKKIKPKDVALFGGKVDAEGLSLDDWLINPSLRVEAGDYRDWAEIETWAKSIVRALKKENVLVHS